MTIVLDLILDRVITQLAPIESKAPPYLFKASMLLFAAAVLMMLVGNFVWLESAYNLHIAMFATGGLTLVLSVIGLASVYFISAFKRKKIQEAKVEIFEFATELFEAVEDEIAEPIQENPKSAVLLTALSGYLTGEQVKYYKF